MKRLTRRKEDGTAYVQLYSDSDRPADIIKERARKEVEVIERLAHYEDLAEQGLLVELPCKVGDTVYDVVFCDDGQHHIHSMLVKSVATYGSIRKVKGKKPMIWHVYLEDDYTYSYRRFCDFGKTVFLTCEEAEAKLAEKGGV